MSKVSSVKIIRLDFNKDLDKRPLVAEIMKYFKNAGITATISDKKPTHPYDVVLNLNCRKFNIQELLNRFRCINSAVSELKHE